MFIQVVFILVYFLGVEAGQEFSLHINGKDTGETIVFKKECDPNEVKAYLKTQGIISVIVTECYTERFKSGHRWAKVTVEKRVNIYEETGLNGFVVSFTWRRESFRLNLGIQKDDKGTILSLKDRKTKLTGDEIWKKLNLEDSDILYKQNPEAIKIVKEMVKFEIKSTTESGVILEELNALYITRLKN